MVPAKVTIPPPTVTGANSSGMTGSPSANTFADKAKEIGNAIAINLSFIILISIR